MITNGVYFDNIHSFDDLNLILSAVSIPPAKAKTNFVEIPAADGAVDLTEALGEVKFADRDGVKITFTMNPAGDLSESAWEAKKTEVSNLLNGKRCKVRLDKDPDYFWQGRCSVDEYNSDRRIRQIVVGAKFAPYKLKKDVTRVFIPFSGKNLFNSENLPLLGGSGCDLSVIDTGIRATWRSGTTSYLVAKFLPVQMLIGKTITMSATISQTGGANALLRIGYSTTDGTNRVAKKSLIRTGQVSFTVGEDAADFDNLAIWFYCNDGVDVSALAVGDYVDYANLQIEIGSAATEYEPYSASTDPQEVTLTNARKTVCPTIICTGETTLNISGGEFTMNEGTHKVLDLQLKEGETTVSVSGTGAVAFVYQEGDL